MGDLQVVKRVRNNDNDINAEEKALYRQKIAYTILSRIREINKHKRSKKRLMRKLYEHFGLSYNLS